MISGGKWLPEEPFDNFLHRSFETRGLPYQPERHTRRVLRWNPGRFYPRCHATRAWAAFGRIEIARKRP